MPNTLVVLSTSIPSWIFGGVAKNFVVGAHVWLNSPTLKFVQVDDGSWKAFYDYLA
jgi:hypothetical protein